MPNRSAGSAAALTAAHEHAVGIDVGKATLEVAFTPTAPVRRFANDPAGRRALVAALTPRPPARIILEASGGYERGVLYALAEAGLPVLRINPRQVRDYARSRNILAKTDALDARVLAAFGRDTPLTPRPLPDAAQRRVTELATRRAQVVQMRTMELNRLEQTTDPFLTRTIRTVLKTYEAVIAKIEAESAEVIAAHAQLQRRYDVLTSVPGVGAVTAGVLLGQMPELGALTRQEVAALAGLAPFNQDSGAWRGERHIRGGRAAVRTALYMATLSAARCNPAIRAALERYTAAGKPYKVAMAACMRKLLVILNALVREDKTWEQRNPKKDTDLS